MSKTDTNIPVLIKYNNKLKRLFNIIYSIDNSIYFKFINEKEYKINTVSLKEYNSNTDDFQLIERNLVKEEDIYLDPKISFHPGKSIVHINSIDNKHFKEDYELYNYRTLSNNNTNRNDFICYLIQILIPSSILPKLKDYNKNHKEKIIIEDNIKKNEYLNIELIIHDSNTNIDSSILPISINRNFKYIIPYKSNYKYSTSIVVSTINGDIIDDFITISINTKHYNLLYTMITNN